MNSQEKFIPPCRPSIHFYCKVEHCLHSPDNFLSISFIQSVFGPTRELYSEFQWQFTLTLQSLSNIPVLSGTFDVDWCITWICQSISKLAAKKNKVVFFLFMFGRVAPRGKCGGEKSDESTGYKESSPPNCLNVIRWHLANHVLILL